jgi:hypothetical protein
MRSNILNDEATTDESCTYSLKVSVSFANSILFDGREQLPFQYELNLGKTCSQQTVILFQEGSALIYLPPPPGLYGTPPVRSQRFNRQDLQ